MAGISACKISPKKKIEKKKKQPNKKEDILTDFTAMCSNDWCSFRCHVRRGDTKKYKKHAEICEVEHKVQ